MQQQVQPGTYIGKVQDYWTTENKDGIGAVIIMFQFGDNLEFRAPWRGNFSSEKATELSLKALALLGLPRPDPSLLQPGPKSGVLDTDKQFELAVKHREHNGTVYLEVAFVNEIGSGAARSKHDSYPAAARAFSGLNLEAEAARLGLAFKGTTAPRAAPPRQAVASAPRQAPVQQAQRVAPPPPGDEDIPF